MNVHLAWPERSCVVGAPQAFELLLQRPKAPPGAVLQALLDVCRAAIHKAGSVEAALRVVRDLAAAGLARHEGIHTQLIQTCGRLRRWQEAVAAFEGMEAVGVRATTETFNSLILACVRGGQLDKVRGDAVRWGRLPRHLHARGAAEREHAAVATRGEGVGCV
jgi:pentatricopeptide repeat protein